MAKKLMEKYDDLTKMSQQEAAQNLHVAQPFLHNLLKSRDKIQTAVLQNSDLNRKQNRHGKDAKVEKALKNWFSAMRGRDTRVGSKILKNKAEQLATKMSRENFTATKGWFTRWKKRENLVYNKPPGEQQDADHRAAVSWILGEWPKIISEYEPDQTYNADEMALYFRTLPEHTHSFKGDKGKGVKISPERVTILYCASMAGEKRGLFLIGKAKSPRCFK